MGHAMTPDAAGACVASIYDYTRVTNTERLGSEEEDNLHEGAKQCAIDLLFAIGFTDPEMLDELGHPVGDELQTLLEAAFMRLGTAQLDRLDELHGHPDVWPDIPE